MSNQERVLELIELVKSSDIDMQIMAINELISVGEKGVLTLTKLLEDINVTTEVRIKIVHLLLTYIKNKSVLDALLNVASSEKVEIVRAEAIAVLGYAKQEDVFNFLMKIVREETNLPQVGAIIGLGKFQDQRAVNIIASFLENKKKFRVKAVEALSEIGGETVVDVLTGALEACDDYFLQYHIIKALGEIGNKRSLRTLEAIKEKETTDPIDILDGPSFTKVLDTAIQTIKENSNKDVVRPLY